MTAAVGAEAISGAGAGAGEGAAAAGARTSASAPSASAPVGATGAKKSAKQRPSAAKKSAGQGGKDESGLKMNPKAAGERVVGKRPKATLHLKGRGQKLLLAEFILSAVIIALSPLTDRHKADPPSKIMKRSTAIAALYLVLALLSTGGKGATRVAAAFGGLVTVALLVSERDIFVVIAKRFNAGEPTGPAGPTGTAAGPDDSIGGTIGGIVGGGAGQVPGIIGGIPPEWWRHLPAGR